MNPTAQLLSLVKLSRGIAVLPVLLLFGSSLMPSFAQDGQPPGRNPQPLLTGLNSQQIARLERDVPHLMAEGEIPGLSIAVVRNGKLAWSRGFGVKNSETREPVGDNTVFEAASLSKPVFAYAVLKLVEEGKLDLDTPLNKYLPGTYDVGDDPRLDQITVRRVLSHTTGFPNWRPRGDKTLKIYFTPGDRFSYSGEGFVYLSRVVEHITGEKLDVFMKRTVLEPFGMTSSSYVWQDDYEKRKTFTHNSVGGVSGRGKPDKANAAASLQTTANDYARFVCAIISAASDSDRQAITKLKPETVHLMLTPQISVAVASSNTLNLPNPTLSTSISWGLGWGLQKTDDGISFWHWGDNGDTKSYVVGFPYQKSAVVMFANSANGLSIIRELVDCALGSQQPALSWINYEAYNSPARLMFKAMLKSTAETVLADYRKRRQMSDKVQLRESNLALSEEQMNRIGYQLLSLKRVKDAIAVFTQNTIDFPDAFNTWDSLAEGYMISGDKASAIKYYKKSLQLNPDNTNAVDKLKELGG
jgi:CubicO group peptidase (beta-lactamase class C family)